MNEIFDRNNEKFSRSSNSRGSNVSRSPTAGSIEPRIEKSGSIVSGSQRLQDLQELHKELSKSSYEPVKPLLVISNELKCDLMITGLIGCVFQKSFISKMARYVSGFK